MYSWANFNRVRAHSLLRRVSQLYVASISKYYRRISKNKQKGEKVGCRTPTEGDKYVA